MLRHVFLVILTTCMLSGHCAEVRAVQGADGKAKTNAYPFMVQVWSASGDDLCGGTLISPQWVLTAAHCVSGGADEEFEKADRQTSAKRPNCEPSNDEYVVYAGSTQLKSGDRIKVIEACQHPEFNPFTLTNDLALLRLERAPKSSVKTDSIVPATDVLEQTHFRNPADVTLIGWGSTGAEDQRSRDLLEARIKVVERQECNRRLRSYNREQLIEALGTESGKGGFLHRLEYLKIGDTQEIVEAVADLVVAKAGDLVSARMICAGDKSGLKNHCHDDSGGPLFTKDARNRFIQMGIVSWGERCGKEPIPPGLYTHVASYSDWIQATAK